MRSGLSGSGSAVEASGKRWVSPDGAGDEVGVVAVLFGEQAVAAGFAPADSGYVAKVVEPLYAGGDHNQGVGGAGRGGTEGVVTTRWDDQEVAGAGGDDLRSDQQVERSVDDEEQFGGVVVSMGDRAVGAVGELDAVGAERAVAGAGVGLEIVADLGQVLGFAGADDDWVVRVGGESRNGGASLFWLIAGRGVRGGCTRLGWRWRWRDFSGLCGH